MAEDFLSLLDCICGPDEAEHEPHCPVAQRAERRALAERTAAEERRRAQEAAAVVRIAEEKRADNRRRQLAPVYEPLPPKRGHTRQYRVRWQREGRPVRSKLYSRFQHARGLAIRLEDEKKNPGRAWNVRKGRSVTKSPVDWVAMEMAYVRAAGSPACLCDCGCGEEFHPTRSDQRYVDTAHRMRAMRARRTAA